jgi:hypothetical protein
MIDLIQEQTTMDYSIEIEPLTSIIFKPDEEPPSTQTQKDSYKTSMFILSSLNFHKSPNNLNSFIITIKKEIN